MSTQEAPCGTYSARRRHYRRNETCNTCEPIKPRPLAKCGTKEARNRHRRRKETCNTCNKTRTKTLLAPCGTPTARKRHKKHGEQCTTCDNLRRTKPLAPCGTPAAKDRHRRNKETCPTCTTEPKTIHPCPSPAAYQRHKRAGEHCAPCTEAWRLAKREEQARRNMDKIRPMNTAELVEEITFLLNAGEGEARILKAIGYTGRTRQLRDRLHKHGHQNLANRLLNPWDLAA